MEKFSDIDITNDAEEYDDAELSRQLSFQIEDELSMQKKEGEKKGRKTRFKHKKLMVCLSVFIILGTIAAVILGTRFGRKFIYNMTGEYIGNSVNRDEETNQIMENLKEEQKEKKDIYNYLIFGIEEIGGAKNTDSMMIASVNMKKGLVKLISLSRDSYVEIPGWRSFKLNAAYAKGGVSLLMDTIELNYKVELDGYASVNFEAFESIIDLLGGVDIELGSREAQYLRTTNYISNPAYRDVVAGMNHLNGNQTLGYCRVRKVPTIEGVNNDYGRTLRQRKVMTEIFNSAKSLPLTEMFSTAQKCLGYVTTSLTGNQISDLIETVFENGMPDIKTLRLPMDDMFEAPVKYEGVGYPLVYDWEKNNEALYNFINDIEEPTEIPEEPTVTPAP